MIRCLFLLGIVLAVREAAAQGGYSLVGSAKPGLLPDCYQLTESRPRQTGAVWSDRPLRVDESFQIEFTVNLGADSFGADGVVLVFQTVGDRALGDAGLGIGYRGMRPSLGIEFDTYRNTELGDPDMDHVALVRDGISDHRLHTAFGPPVQLSSISRNAKDGRDHRVRVAYDAPSRRLEVYVDCVRRISQFLDLPSVFERRPEVFWGFTAATGNFTNAHTVCLQKNIVAKDTLAACRGETLTLVASGPSSTDRYDWQPAAGLSDPTSRTPSLRVASSQLFTVRYRDRCLAPRLDSVFVRVETPPAVSLGGDRSVCENEAVELVASLTPAAPQARFRWSTGDSTRRIRPTQSGRYAVWVLAGSCSAADSAVLTFHPVPQLAAPADPDDCLRDQPLLLDPRATAPTPLRYAWTPTASTAPTLTVSAAGTYAVRVSTEFNCFVEKTFAVRADCAARVFVPEAFSPNGDGVNDELAWFSTEPVEARLTVYDRWGEVLFFDESSRGRWDGTVQGQPVPPGSYAWRLEYRPQRLGDAPWFVKRGQVVVVR